jgi:hypothetical protein
MSLSQSPMLMQPANGPSTAIDWRELFNQRKLSDCAINTRVGLILRFSTVVTLIEALVQTFNAVGSSDRPFSFASSSECILKIALALDEAPAR